MNRTKLLGTYLLIGGIFQASLYLAISIFRDRDWLFYFDPRLGIFFLESSWRGTEQSIPGVMRWMTVVWILTLACLLLSGRRLIKTYAISEIVLLLPNVFFFVTIALVNLSPAHGFSRRRVVPARPGDDRVQRYSFALGILVKKASPSLTRNLARALQRFPRHQPACNSNRRMRTLRGGTILISMLLVET